MKKLIITRHKALVEFLKEKGIEGEVLEHASPEDVAEKDVYGILPLNLACEANSITTVDLAIPFEKRGQELNIEDIKSFYKGMQKYVVRKEVGK